MAEEQPLVTVTLAVPMSEGEFGYTGKAGDQIEVPVDTANAWIDAGIAEPLVRASVRVSLDEAPAPRVPRRGGAS